MLAKLLHHIADWLYTEPRDDSLTILSAHLTPQRVDYLHDPEDLVDFPTYGTPDEVSADDERSMIGGYL